MNVELLPVRCSDYRRKKVFLYFWSAHSKISLDEMVFLQRLSERYTAEPVVLVVNGGAGRSTVKRFVNDTHFWLRLIQVGKSESFIR